MSDRAKYVGCGSAILIFLVVIVGGIIWITSIHKTDPGNVGIIINYGSLSGGKPKVEIVPTNQLMTIWPWQPETFIEYSTAQQSLVMTAKGGEGEVSGYDAVACQDKNGIAVGVDTTVLWQVNPAEAGVLYQLRPGQPLTGDFNNDIESTVVRRYARSAVAQACRNYTWDSVGGNESAIMASAYKIMAPELAQYGILVPQNGVLGGEISYSTQQQQQIDQLSQAQLKAQQTQYLLQQAQNQAAAQVAQAKGEAQAIQIIDQALASNPNYLQYLLIKEWDGHLPSYLAGGNNPIVGPFINGKP